MPYASTGELPPAVKKLSPKKQKQWLAVFNSAHAEYKGDEAKAFASAWSAVGGAPSKESWEENKTMKNGFRDLFENHTLEEAMVGTNIDDANGVLSNVVLLTANKKSLNNTFYTTAALTEAVGRYEGAKMFIDHPKNGETNRSIQDFGGTYKNVRMEGDKLIADLQLLESKRSMVMGIAKMRPAGVGLSIKDKGRGVEKDGVFFVEGFAPKAQFSIDMVCEPSVNKDLFEAKQNQDEKLIEEGGDDMDFKSLTVDQVSKERPDLIESIQNAGKAAILKDLEEAKTKGMKSETMAAKILALIEADFAKDIREAVQKMIEPDAITLDAAKAIISGQKLLIEALSKKSKVNDGKPVVTNLGARKEDEVSEGAKDLPSDEDLISAFRR